MKMVKNLLAKVALLMCGLVLALILLEVSVRILGLYRFPKDDFIQPHPELGWSHIANKKGYWSVGEQRIEVEINSKGLRDKEYAYKKKEGIFRILVLGDSFIEGFQVRLDDTVCKVLEHELNRLPGHFEVINAGFGGVGTDYELLFLRREGFKYHPDLVMLGFFANDVYDNYRSKAILDNEAGFLAYEKKGLAVSVRKFLAKNSCAYNYFGTVLPNSMPFLANLLMKTGLLSFQPIDDVEGPGASHYEVLAARYGPRWQQAWEVTKILISEIQRKAADGGSEFAVIGIPFREQVYESRWKSLIEMRPSLKKREWDLDRPEREVSRFLDDAKIPFLPLLPHFRRASEKCELYYTGPDGHWNVAGHQLAGKIIFDWLVEERLVPVVAEG